MSWKKHDDQCPGCLPVLIDVITGKPLPESHPAVKAIMSVWVLTSKEEREAFHEFTCNNSRDEKIIEILKIVQAKFGAAIRFTEEERKNENG